MRSNRRAARRFGRVGEVPRHSRSAANALPLDYVVDTVSSPGYIVPAFGKARPKRGQINAVTVEYTAGAAIAPHALKAWMLLLSERCS